MNYHKAKISGIFLIPLLMYAVCGLTTQTDLDLNNRENIPVLSGSLFLDMTSTSESLIAVGERGHILMSSNGQEWQMADVPVDVTLTSVYFHDSRNGWAAGHDAVILRTTDGGRHWRKVHAAPENEQPVLDIWFADENNGIAIGAYGLYLISTDGGETWNQQQLNVIDESGSGDNTDLADSYELHLNAIAVSDSGKLYITAEAGRIYRSDNLGKQWKGLSSPYTGSFFGVLTLDNESLLVYGLRGHLFRSDNGGESWYRIETGTRELLTNGARLQNDSILLTGMGGTLLISTDDGHTFRLLQPGHRHNYAALIEIATDRILLAGDHGIEPLVIHSSVTPDD